jgi:uncharacterized membrane protein YgdD (TMEM256/DUF423 family)
MSDLTSLNQNSKDTLYDSKTWISTACAFLVLSIFAFGPQIFNLMLSGDGWTDFVSPIPTQYEWTIRIGRFLSPLMWTIFGDNELASSWLYFYFFSSIWFLFFLILSRTKHISPASVFVSSSIFLFTPSLVEMSVFQIDIPVRSTGLVLLGLSLYFGWAKCNKYLIIYKNLSQTITSIACLTLCAACYQPIALMFIPAYLLMSILRADL